MNKPNPYRGNPLLLAAVGNGPFNPVMSPVASPVVNPFGLVQGIVTANQLLQYKFNEGTGTNVVDYSGNGYNGTTYNGGNWSSKGFNFGTGGAGVSIPIAVAAQVQCIQLFIDSGAGVVSGVLCGYFARDSASNGMYGASNTGQIFFSGTSNQVSTGAAQLIHGPNCITINCKSGVNNQLFFNGNQPIMLAVGTGGFGAASSSFYLGRNGGAFFNRGSIYYALMYSQPLTQTQIQQNINAVSAVLAARGVTIGDTTNYSYPFIVFNGDSLTAGTNSTSGNNYPDQLKALLSSNFYYTNLGIGGQTLQNMVATGSTFDPLYNPYPSTPRINVIWGGINDVIELSASATTIYSNMVSYCNARHAAGQKTIFSDIISCGNSGLNQTTFTALRAALQTLYLADNPTQIGTNLWTGSSYGDVYIALSNDSNIGQATSYTNATYFSPVDFTHLTNAGYAIVAGYEKTALNYLGIT